MAQYEITSETLPLDFECTTAGAFLERTLRNAKNLIMLRMGEVPYDRQRGLDPAIFELPFDEANSLITPELDRALLWEPDVEVVSGWLEQKDGETIVHCIIETTFEE